MISGCVGGPSRRGPNARAQHEKVCVLVKYRLEALFRVHMGHRVGLFDNEGDNNTQCLRLYRREMETSCKTYFMSGKYKNYKKIGSTWVIE